MLPLSMAASSASPFAIRARLSTEDSASDASSSFLADDISDDSSAINDDDDDDDDDASLMRPFMPIARVTLDDDEDDDDERGLFYGNEEKDGNLGDGAEEDLDFSAFVCEKIGADSEKSNLVGEVQDGEAKCVEAEFGVWEGVEEEADGDIGSENGLLGAVEDGSTESEGKLEKIGADSEKSNLFGENNTGEVVKVEACGDVDSENGLLGVVEDGSAESEGFDATNAVGFSHGQILEMVSIHDSKAFEPKHPEVFAVNMEAEKDEDLYWNVDSEKTKDSDVSADKMMAYPAQYLDDFKEKNDESRAVFTCEFSSDNSSPFCAYEKEMESRFDDEDSAEEDQHLITEWPAKVAILEKSESVKHFLKEMEEGSCSSHSGSYSHILDGQTISNSDEERRTDEDGDAKELFDISALAALLRAASGASSVGVAHFTSPLHSDMEIAGEHGNDMSDEEKMLLHLKVGRKISEEFSLEMAKKVALQLDEGKGDFTFSCTILVIGKTGVGKSAAINSIFGEERAFTDPFQPATTSVREFCGVVDGVYIRVIDTPGLLTSLNDQRANRKILSSIKKYTSRCPPDVVLYVDRLDAYNRDFNELHIFRMITSILGKSIWFNAIIALTHAASDFPDGPDGSSLSYEVVVAQRSKFVQQSIRQAAEDDCLVNSVALVENHPSCRRNIDGESILPNGLGWRPWLLLLCYSSKILSDVNSLPAFLSSLLQSKAHSKPSTNYDSDIDLDNMTKVLEEDDDYNQLPPFKPLRKSQIQKLTEEQKNAYFDEYDHTLKLLHENMEAIKNPTYLYQFLEPRSRLLTRPVLHTHSWDYDSGYDGASIDERIDILRQFPASLAVQIMKEKKEFTVHMDSSIESKHGEKGCTFATFNIKPVGMQLACSLQCETKFKNLKKNKTAAGILVTCSGETLVNGFKLEDQMFLGKKLCLVASTGVVRAQRNVACGVNLEVCFREKDYPIGLSVIKWKDFAVGANFQSEFSTGRNSKMAVCVGLNNRNSGQISIKTSSTEQVHIALFGLFSLLLSIFRSKWNSESN